jgi:hypothetical protein
VDSTITLSAPAIGGVELPNIKYIWYEVVGSDYTAIPSDSANVLKLTKSEAGTYKFAVKRLNTQTGLLSDYSEDRTVTVTELPTGGPGDDAPVTLNDFSNAGVTFRVYEKSGNFLGKSPVNYTVTVKKFGFGFGDKVRIVGLGQTLTNVTTTDGVTVAFTIDEAAQELVADTMLEAPYYVRAIDAIYTGTGVNPTYPEVYIVTQKAGTAQVTNELKAEVKRVNGKITIFIPSKTSASGDDVSYTYYGRIEENGTTYYSDFITTRYGDDATNYGWPGQTGTVIVEE